MPKLSAKPAAQARREAARKALQQAEAVCARDNLRLTAIRRRILELVWRARRPAKAYDLLKKLNGNPGYAAPPTVYRALDFLLRNGFIHKIKALNAYIGCPHPLHKSPHWCILVHCAACGKVDECCDDKTTASVFRLISGSGFCPSTTALEVEGQCADCNGKPRRKRRS